MAQTNWFVGIEYPGPRDANFENDLWSMADERGGRFGQSSDHEPSKARYVAYMFPSEEVANEYNKAVKDKYLYGTDRTLYVTVYSDTDAPPQMQLI